MQDYINFAKKNGIQLLEKGRCQFCGAHTRRGVHECIEIFNLDIKHLDFSIPENHIYKFLIIDAHALQHPEIHGRWNNHFHLSRLHLIFKYHIHWTYNLSPKLSDCLNEYKARKPKEHLNPPNVFKRGAITSTDILRNPTTTKESKELIKNWALFVYNTWEAHQKTIDVIAIDFLKKI